MSKVLKTIVALILIVFIAAGSALIIPQFLGIDTVVVQENMLGNVPVGTAIYAKKEASAGLAKGDRMLDLKADSVNIYTVSSYDISRQIVTVEGAAKDEYAVSNYYLNVLRTVPLIGYLTIATQSTKGLAILAALLVLVIFLFICSEIIRRGKEADEADMEYPGYDSGEEDDDFYRKLADKKKKKERSARVEEHFEKFDPEEEEDRSLAEADARDGMKPVVPDRVEEPDEPSVIQEKSLGTDSLPDVQAALEAALESQPVNHEGTMSQMQLVPDDTPAMPNENGEVELAMPVHTTDEFLQKAYSDGLDPTIRHDDTTGTTLIDFSDCL